MARSAKASRGKRRKLEKSAAPDPQPNRKSKRILTPVLALLALGVLATAIVLSNQSSDPIGSRTTGEGTSGKLVEVDFKGNRSTWQLLALTDEELEKVSLVELNLAVVREIPGYEDIDITKYEKIVDQWTREFAKELPTIDATFRGREAEYQNDLRFYRIGQLMAWLGHEKNIEYIPEQRNAKSILYKDPGDLFLNGLLDTSLGTCGNMPTLQAAIARRLGWPVALAPIESHTVCRFDDGEVAYNIETTHTDKGGFSSGTQEEYAHEFKLPPCAFTQADTLETMTAREMLAYFISLRGRYYWDTGQWEKADQDHALARALLPRHRKILLASMELGIQRGDQLFDARESQHPMALFARAGQMHQAIQQQARRQQVASHQSTIAEIERINAQNRRRWETQNAQVEAYNHQLQQQWNQPGGSAVPQPPDPFQPYTQQPPY